VLERALGRAVCACAALVVVTAWLEAARDRARIAPQLSSTAPAGTAESRSR
jgi:hypothetical protein